MPSDTVTEDLILLLAVAGHVGKETLERRLADAGLGVRERTVLRVIDAGAPTQLSIAARSGLDKSTLLPVLDRLEQKRLIERRPDPADRRVRIVTVTPAGRRALADSRRTVTDVEGDLLRDLSAAEQETFRSLLRRVVEGRMSTMSVPGSCL